MQSSDNFDAAVVSQFLADCGFSLSASGSLGSLSTPASCIRTQPAFFPSIAYRHRLRCFTLYFQGPHRCGLQRFNFSEADFFDAFENSKFLGLAASSYDDDSRVPFDQSDLFANSGRSDRIYPKLVFKFFFCMRFHSGIGHICSSSNCRCCYSHTCSLFHISSPLQIYYLKLIGLYALQSTLSERKFLKL